MDEDARLLDLVHLGDGFFGFRLFGESNEAKASTTVGVLILDHNLKHKRVNLV